MPKNDKSERTPREFERRIRAQYAEMPNSERALANRVLEYPNEVLTHSATELSVLAGASKAAVSRFVKRLGYADFREMQREIRQAQTTGDPIFLTASPEGRQTSLSAHLEKDILGLRQTIETIDSSAVEAVARRIISARRVCCLGYRNSYFFAGYLSRQLVQIRPDVSLIPRTGLMLMEEASDLGPDDLLIAIGLRRRPAHFAAALKIFHQRGVPIAYVADRRAVSTRRYATWAFPCQVRGMSLFDSYVGTISLLNYICTRAYDISGAKGRTRLGGIEEMLEELQELDPEN